MKCLIVFFLVIIPITLSATTRYVAQSAGTFSGGTACNGHTAITPATWNSTSESGDDITYVCGTITGSANSTILTFGWSGTSGHPITLMFDTGGIVQAPYCHSSGGGSAGGCIAATGRNYVVIDGNNLQGIVRNTLNGASDATCSAGPCTQSAGTNLVDMQNCSNCTLKNLNLLNSYVPTQQNLTMANSSNEYAFMGMGTNLTLSGNNFSNCGWCLNFTMWNGQGNMVADHNSFSAEYGHAIAAFAGSSGAICTAPCFVFHDNDFGGAGLGWDVIRSGSCDNHKDGIHMYESGASSIGTVYTYNNYFHGDWGSCPTGYIFTETDQMADYQLWNNVFVVSGTVFQNTNSWVYLGSMPNGGSTNFYSNTFYDTLSTAGTTCVKQGFSTRTGTLNVRDNGMANCSTPFTIDGSTISGTIANNLYGSNTSLKLNSDGSLQATSSLRNAGANLSSLAIGNLATLANDTTNGGQRTSVARPTGSTAWDIGAYQYAAVTTHTLTVSSTGAGAGTISGSNCTSGSKSDGTSVTCHGAASAGSTFAGWAGTGDAAACSGTSDCAFTISQDSTATATFTLNSYTLTVSSAGTGTGTISGSNCTTGSKNYGTSVTCHGAASGGSSFIGWGGTGDALACSGAADCAFTISQTTGATATFNLTPSTSNRTVSGNTRMSGSVH